MGTGTDASATESLKDFWRYNASTDTWTQMSDVGGIGRWSAIGFGIGNKGYVGTGLVGTPGSGFTVNDFWEYDPATNTWTIKQNVGLTGRSGAVAFSIGGKGYVTTGFRSNEVYDNSTYEYDPSTNIWTSRSAFPANEREDAGGFVIGSEGYVVGGVRYSTNPWLFVTLRDTYAFNPTSNSWTYKTLYPSGVNNIHYVRGFSVSTKGYALIINAGGTSSLIEYNSQSNTWLSKSSPPNSMHGSVSFALSGIGYMATGVASNSKKVSQYLSDELRISGPQLVCSSANSVFSLNYVYPGSSINWTTSSNLTIVGGQGSTELTVIGNSIGSGFARATVSLPSGSSYFQQSDFWVGPYGSSNYPINGPGFACSFQFLTYSTTSLPGATAITWTVPGDWTIVSGQGTPNLAVTSGSSSGAVTVRVDNPCGIGGSPAVKFTQINSCGGFAMQSFPNPASTELTIEISDESGLKRDPGTIGVQLINRSLESVYSCESNSSQIKIPVTNLPEGIYFLNAFTRAGTIRKQIVVRR